mgnify:CR=1 FL=1
MLTVRPAAAPRPTSSTAPVPGKKWPRSYLHGVWGGGRGGDVGMGGQVGMGLECLLTCSLDTAEKLNIATGACSTRPDPCPPPRPSPTCVCSCTSHSGLLPKSQPSYCPSVRPKIQNHPRPPSCTYAAITDCTTPDNSSSNSSSPAHDTPPLAQHQHTRRGES